VSAVAIGGGQGGGAYNNARGGIGGGLGARNNMAVTPGSSYTVVVGAGGAGASTDTGGSNGADYSFTANSGVYTSGSGGNGGTSSQGTIAYDGGLAGSGSAYGGGEVAVRLAILLEAGLAAGLVQMAQVRLVAVAVAAEEVPRMLSAAMSYTVTAIAAVAQVLWGPEITAKVVPLFPKAQAYRAHLEATDITETTALVVTAVIPFILVAGVMAPEVLAQTALSVLSGPETLAASHQPMWHGLNQ
jgi:hypothetical protein